MSEGYETRTPGYGCGCGSDLAAYQVQDMALPLEIGIDYDDNSEQ